MLRIDAAQQLASASLKTFAKRTTVGISGITVSVGLSLPSDYKKKCTGTKIFPDIFLFQGL